MFRMTFGDEILIRQCSFIGTHGSWYLYLFEDNNVSGPQSTNKTDENMKQMVPLNDTINSYI